MRTIDTRGRELRDLRISVTDRCNFRCTYCMPREVFGGDFPFLPREELLTFEEITRLARTLVPLGVRKIRLTGGEPLLRRDLPRLVGMLAAIDGMEDLALTTNGSLLDASAARALSEAGLQRITISLDAVDDAVFRRMTDARFPVGSVLAAIEAADAAGLHPIKIDAVIRRGVNESEILPLARRFRGTPHILRFIEYMDVGSSNGWARDEVVTGDEILSRLASEWPLEPLAPQYPGEVARRWRYRDGRGEIGVITSISRPFCGDCTRARLTADGRMFLCLFASAGHDLRTALRSGLPDDELSQMISAIWSRRSDAWSELRTASTETTPRIEMSRIGG